jgi:hypothetical protein
MRTLIYVLVLLGASACGGGGGNAGTCFGSAAVCGLYVPTLSTITPDTTAVVTPTTVISTNTASITTTSVAIAISQPVEPLGFVRVPDAQLATITCSQIKALNNNDKIAYALAAKDAYDRGRRDLDGGDKDGIPCNGVP